MKDQLPFESSDGEVGRADNRLFDDEPGSSLNEAVARSSGGAPVASGDSEPPSVDSIPDGRDVSGDTEEAASDDQISESPSGLGASPERDGGASSPGESPEAPDTRGVLTNRWNLIEFLSRRLIVPSEAFVKYYDDLLRFTPGRVPIVATPLSEEMVAAVTGDDPDVTFPVFIELDGEALDASPVVIPWTRVRTVHFRDDRERGEHSAREFDNVSASPRLAVSPGLFTGGSETPESLVAAEGEAVGSVSEALDLAARWSGAVVTGIHALSRNGDRSSALALARLLDGRSWGKVGCAHLQVLQPMRSGQPPADGEGLERRVFSEVVRSFVADGLPGDPVSFVRTVGDRVELDDESRRAFDRIAEILDGDVEFKPFKGSGLPVAKGLLMALLRKQPDRLLPWAVDQARADPATILTAAVLLGLAAGRHTLSRNLRPDDLDAALALVECSAAERSVRRGSASVESSKPSQDGSSTHTISLAGFPDIRLIEPPEPLLALVSAAEPLDPELQEACIALAVAQGWTEALALRADVLIEKLTAAEPAGPEAEALRRMLEAPRVR